MELATHGVDADHAQLLPVTCIHVCAADHAGELGFTARVCHRLLLCKLMLGALRISEQGRNQYVCYMMLES